MSMAIDRSIIGLSVKGKNTDFGQIIDLIEIKHDNEFLIIAIMSTGKNLTLDSIRKLFASQNLTLKRDEKGNLIPIVFPDGAAYSKYSTNTKKKQRAFPLCAAQINTIAKIGDERINIAITVDSNDPIKYEKI